MNLIERLTNQSTAETECAALSTIREDLFSQHKYVEATVIMGVQNRLRMYIDLLKSSKPDDDDRIVEYIQNKLLTENKGIIGSDGTYSTLGIQQHRKYLISCTSIL